MSHLSPAARSLLRDARSAALPSSADRARSLAALQSALGAAAPAVAPSTASGWGLKAKVLIGLAATSLTIGGGAALYHARSIARQPPPAVASAPEDPRDPPHLEPAAPAPVVADLAASDAPALPSPVAAPAAASDDVHAAPSRASAARAPDGTGDDLALIARAREALAAHRAQEALGVLGEHARRFPRSPFGEERAYTRVRALCELGRAAQARAEAERFLRIWPASVYGAGVRRSCGGAATDPAPVSR